MRDGGGGVQSHITPKLTLLTFQSFTNDFILCLKNILTKVSQTHYTFHKAKILFSKVLESNQT